MATDGPDRYDGGPSVAELLTERFGPHKDDREVMLAELARERFNPTPMRKARQVSVRRRSKSVHMFVDDPEARDPHSRQQWCMCGLPAENDKHRLPQRSDADRAHEARRIGEGTSEEGRAWD